MLKGLSLALDPKLPSSPLISKWARELVASSGSVAHVDAVSREQYIVEKINSHTLPPRAYHDYQRFAAGTGNVDSAKLLLAYGVGLSVQAAKGRIFQYVRSCQVDRFFSLVAEDEDVLASQLGDGTDVLLTATFVNCLPIVRHLLSLNNAGSVVAHLDLEHTALNGMTALMVAAACGHVEILVELAAHGALVHAAHPFAGTNALHLASELDQAEAIRAICRLCESDVLRKELSGSRTTLGSMPLHVAAQHNASAATVLALTLACAADVNALLNNDTTPLYLAAQEGHLAAMRGLLQAGANVQFAMPETQYRGSSSLVSREEQSAGEGNYASSWTLNLEAGNGAQAVHVAAENGHHLALQFLLQEGGADVNSQSIGSSPLHLAVQYNRLECVRVLIAHAGTNIDIRARTDGCTPLYYASGKGFLEIARLLLDAGASLENVGRGGGTPLLYAVLSGHTSVVELLVRGCDERKDVQRTLVQAGHDGLTPAGAALEHGNSAIVGFLFQCIPSRGRDVQILAKREKSAGVEEVLLPPAGGIYRYSPLHLAAKHAHAHLIGKLLDWGHDAHVTVVGTSITPLLLSVQSGCVECVARLLRAGGYLMPAAPPPRSPDKYDSPLLLAIDRNSTKIVRLLIEGGGAMDLMNQGFLGPQAGVYQHPLLLAVVRGRLEIVKLLLAAGSRCDIFVASARDLSRTSSLVDLARERRDFDVLQALLAVPRCSDARKDDL